MEFSCKLSLLRLFDFFRFWSLGGAGGLFFCPLEIESWLEFLSWSFDLFGETFKFSLLVNFCSFCWVFFVVRKGNSIFSLSRLMLARCSYCSKVSGMFTIFFSSRLSDSLFLFSGELARIFWGNMFYFF